MRGVASAQQLIAQADDARKLAEVAAIMEQDSARTALLFEYAQARDANQSTARAVTDEVQRRVQAFTYRLNDILVAAKAVRGAVPVPRDPATGTQFDYSASYITNALTTQDQAVAAALAEASPAAAANIVDLAWQATAPTAPDRAVLGSVDDALDVIKLALAPTAGNSLAANAAAQRILRDAMTDGDSVLIYVLLGSAQARRLYTALQINRTTLARIWAESQIAAVKVDDNGIAPLGADITGGAFLRLQSGPLALAALPALAKSYYDAMRSTADDLLNTSLVKSAMRP